MSEEILLEMSGDLVNLCSRFLEIQHLGYLGEVLLFEVSREGLERACKYWESSREGM